MSLRWKLTLYYSAVSALILLMGGMGFYLVLRQNLRAALDDSLREAATLAASQLGGDEQKPQFSAAETDTLLQRLPGATVLLVFNAKGQLVDQIGTSRTRAPLVEGFTTFGDTRVFTLKLPNGDQIQAQRPQLETLEALSRVQRLLLYGLPVLLLLGVGAGYFLADHALRPVDAVARLAQAIASSGRYRERVPEASGKDEMARLTQTVNAMLLRLEQTIEREKAFALAAAHELRTPLTLLQGRASLTLEKDRSPEQYRQALQKINRDSHELTALVESLLALARTNQSPRQDVVNLGDVALEGVELLSSDASARGVGVELHTQTALTLGDAPALRLVAVNLLQNALKYGSKQVWVRTGARNNLAFLEVCDNGPGIPAEEIQRLLQPFQRGSALQGNGAGLGLALASAVAKQHGGRLELMPAEAGGLKATLYLPLE
ncbi:MAG: HAMP domain-containing histidine kinase [Thermaceae bacterium]|nr:HAMP domain-containing histidine kinase [Thermaceae bacterium]